MPSLSNSDIKRIADQVGAASDARMQDIVSRSIRSYFKSGVPPGSYGSFQWDGTRIVGTGAAATTATANLLVKAHFNAATPASVGNGATARVVLDVNDYDPQEIVTAGASWHITVPVEGWYRVDGALFMRGPTNKTFTAGSFYALYVGNNSSSVLYETLDYVNIIPAAYGVGIAPTVFLKGSCILHLAAGAGVNLVVENQGGTAGNATAPDGSGWIALSYAVPGTVTPAATELNVLRARQYITDASSTLTIAGSATTKVDYNFEDSDPGSELSGGTFTANEAMTVKVAAGVSFTSTVGACQLVARKNGTTDTTIAAAPTNLGGISVLSGTSAGITLAVGNTLEVYIINGTGSSLPVYAPASGGFTPSTGYPHCDFIQIA